MGSPPHPSSRSTRCDEQTIANAIVGVGRSGLDKVAEAVVIAAGATMGIESAEEVLRHLEERVGELRGRTPGRSARAGWPPHIERLRPGTFRASAFLPPCARVSTPDNAGESRLGFLHGVDHCGVAA